ncbi:MAG: thioredoxin fold domain-containing protein [Gammaproteobacteria bacterium]|nr:thioredoxin fold domain-containing protein [Gammaproteobacteria bacterium]MDH3446879.1 thioredoxin fold domain-containing protein [Gammaproteobacteria bacterium]
MNRAGIYLKVVGIILFLELAAPAGAADAVARGKIVGGVPHQAPVWFKQSFLEIADDVDEASEAGKHVMLFFQLNDCPYCDRMLRESFEAEPLTRYIRQHFDTIAINVRGDREIAFNEEISVTEKQLSEILEVAATPAILFLNQDNKTIVRVNGYRAPQRFRQVLEFVATRSYQTTSLADYLQAKLDKNVYQLRANPLFSEVNDLSSVDGPLMVIFEDGSCYDCNEFHDGILAHELVRQEIAPFTVVRLDADSGESIVDVHGNRTTPSGLARKYEMIYRPGVLLFDEGELLRRHDSLTFPHHFKESLRYVAGGFYRQTDYRSYSQQRTEELLEAGVVIDLGRPQ